MCSYSKSYQYIGALKRTIQFITSMVHPFDRDKRGALRRKVLEYFYTLERNKPSSADLSDIPVFIVSYNRLSYLQQMIECLEKYHIKNIHIVDNQSTYPPLLEYLKNTPYTVHYMDKNYGHMVIWKSGKFDEIIKNSHYIVTDPDLELNPNLPADFIEQLFSILEKYPLITKVGFSIKIDDLPDEYADRIEHEKKYFFRKLPHPDLELYLSKIDTTFALYRPGTKRIVFYDAIRVGGNFTVRHLPWYITGTLTEEDIYYKSSANSSSGWAIRQ